MLFGPVLAVTRIQIVAPGHEGWPPECQKLIDPHQGTRLVDHYLDIKIADFKES